MISKTQRNTKFDRLFALEIGYMISKTQRNTKFDRLFALEIGYKIWAPYLCFA